MGHSIRGRLILIFLALSAVPVLAAGLILAGVCHFSGAPASVPAILSVTLIAAAASAGIAVGLGMLVTGRMVRSIQEMTEAAEAIVAGDLTPRTAAVSDDEIGLLAGTFNHMARKVRDRIGTLERREAERTKAMAVFHDVNRVSALADEKRLAAEVVERVRTAFNYYHVQIYFFDEAGKELILAAGTGKAGQALLEVGHMVPKGEGPAGSAAVSKTAVLVADTARDSGWQPNPALPKVKSEIAVPIAAGDEVLGILDVQQNIVNGLTRADAELLQPIADQVALSVRSARLLTRAWQQAEWKDPVAFIGRKIRETSSVEDALRVTARELGRVLSSGETRVLLFELPQAGWAEAESGPGGNR